MATIGVLTPRGPATLGWVLVLLVLLVASRGVAWSATSAGNVCEIDPKRSAIEEAARARATAGQKRFDPSWRTDHVTGEKVYVGKALITDPTGRIAVWRLDERKAAGTGIAIQGRRVEVAPESAVEIKEVREGDRTVEFVRLDRGAVAIHCLGCGAETPNAAVTDTKSHFVMRYSPEAVAVTEVVTVRGAVRVRNPAGGRTVTVGAGQRTLVIAGQPPTDPADLGQAEIDGYLRPFELIGGGAEQSQLVDNRDLGDLMLPTGGDLQLQPPPGTAAIDKAGEPAGLLQPGTPALFGDARLGIEF